MNTVKNYYKIIPKDLIKKSHNPNYKKHMINIPARILIIGASGSGKTNTLFDLIHRMKGTFNTIIICVKNKDEPLYKFLETKIKEGLVFFENGEVPDINDPAFIDDKCYGQTLMIFDDLVLEKDQKKISEWFIRGRKISNGVTCCYLTQSYYRTPKIIRVQCNYIICKKLSSNNDLTRILSEYNLGVNKDELLKLYKYATNQPLDFLLVDIDSPADKRFRKNFLENL